MIYEFPLKVPTYSSETKEWGHRVFTTLEEFKEFLWSKFKVPGKYNLHDIGSWQLEYQKFKKREFYTESVKGTYQYKKYWHTEKEKVLNGVIIDEFYLPPFYYFYLNFLPIYNKVIGKYIAPYVWDSDYHFMLYVALCIVEGKHVGVVKTRQRGYSYKIMAILYWSFCWFEGSVNTLGASDEDYAKKTWKYVDQYRQFIHKNTAWKRGPNQPKSMDWVERTLTSEGDYVGLGSTLSGTTFKQSPSKGVGGPQRFFFYEEAGIAPTLLKTIEYIRPAIEEGNLTTGTIIVSGSVGELKDCEPLKKISRDPEGYNFLGVTPCHKDDEIWGKTCLFVPDSWSRYGFMDENGNSLVEEAEKDILESRKAAKNSKGLEDYQLQISQKPLSLKEAFAFRADSFFPQAILGSQVMRLEATPPKTTVVELFEKDDGSISFTTNTETTPIVNFPITNGESNRGAVVIKEFPIKDAPFLTYFAGIDPISTDKTTTSESLFSCYIFKTLTETKVDGEDGQPKIKVSGFEPVAWYTGRLDDLKQTNTIGEHLVRFYNAFAVVESNVQSFINHMQHKGLQRYLATKADISFLGDLGANREVYKQYGVHMTPMIKNYILSNIKEYISEEMDYVKKEDGERLKTIYGVERIKDIPLLEEIKQWHPDLNTDRIIAFGLALSMAKAFVVNGIYNRINERTKKEEVIKAESRSFFKQLTPREGNVTKSFFKKLV